MIEKKVAQGGHTCIVNGIPDLHCTVEHQLADSANQYKLISGQTCCVSITG